MGSASSSAARISEAPAFGSLETMGVRKLKKKPVLVLDPEELEAAHQLFQQNAAEQLDEFDPEEREQKTTTLFGLAPVDDNDADGDLRPADITGEFDEADLPEPDKVLSLTRMHEPEFEAPSTVDATLHESYNPLASKSAKMQAIPADDVSATELTAHIGSAENAGWSGEIEESVSEPVLEPASPNRETVSLDDWIHVEDVEDTKDMGTTEILAEPGDDLASNADTTPDPHDVEPEDMFGAPAPTQQPEGTPDQSGKQPDIADAEDQVGGPLLDPEAECLEDITEPDEIAPITSGIDPTGQEAEPLILDAEFLDTEFEELPEPDTSDFAATELPEPELPESELPEQELQTIETAELEEAVTDRNDFSHTATATEPEHHFTPAPHNSLRARLVREDVCLARPEPTAWQRTMSTLRRLWQRFGF